MDGNDVSADHVIAELIDMGFEFSQVLEAISAVGPCLHDAVEFILKGSCKNNTGKNVTHGLPSDSYNCSTGQARTLGKRTGQARTLGKRTMSSHYLGKMKQSGIIEHLQPLGGPKKMKPSGAYDVSISGLERFESKPLEVNETSIQSMNNKLATASESYQHDLHSCVPSVKSQTSLQETGNAQLPFNMSQNQDIESNWEQKVKTVLQKHFGFSSLKSFQKEAMEAWLANRDCLVLAATGSGKSLCFQIPALLTGKVVVVISPLISLMHDQCLKLAKHGVSACFLGSGQSDSSVEHKAMHGVYGIIYVCPETVLRLIEPLQMLAENRGIALFAIDEVHCISKWGHDFRPDYRRLSVLRDNFKACILKSLKFDIPLMALTATATTHVREDILESLHMSKGTKIVITSFFRPNLRFSVKHSRTSCKSSYHKDFRALIDTYTTKRMVGKKESGIILDDLEDESDSSSRSANGSISDTNGTSMSDFEDFEDDHIDGNDAEACSENKNVVASKENQLSVEYLEDELDAFQSVDDFDVSCGEFYGDYPAQNQDVCESSDTLDTPIKLEERLRVPQGPLGQGPTIIYVPTRKETVRLTEFLCRYGVRAAAYNAKLPKKHLRRVHEDFHQNTLEVVVATIAFGMGIDKSNVRRIIHYGWPQSLEAYYQEAGRAGRDGKLADCTLYADLSRIPTLLPSQRSEEQTKQAYKMLSDCFRYGMGTACCRARTLVKYFGEDFSYDKCLLCDICVVGPPKSQNLKEEADIFLRALAGQGSTSFGNLSCDDAICSEFKRGRFREKPDFKMVISGIREQAQKFAASDRLWWQGLARILEDKGYIREADDMVQRVCIKYPEPTELGLRFLHSATEQPFYAYPEADMLLSIQNPKSYSTFSEWGRGWADPEIRRQRLQRKKYRKKGTRSKRSSRHHQDLRTVRGRITAKLSKRKR